MDMHDKTDNRWVTGRCVQDQGNSDLYYRTIAEALKWDKAEELVQLVEVTTYQADASGVYKWNKAYQLVEMRISGNEPHLVLTTPDQEEALQMFLQMTFGVNAF